MEIIVQILKAIAGFILSLLAPLLFIAGGVALFILGAYNDWQWMRYTGMVLAAFGVIWIAKNWFPD